MVYHLSLAFVVDIYNLYITSYDEALKDFLTAGQLDMSLASAHTNAGLVIMNYHNNSRSVLHTYNMHCILYMTHIYTGYVCQPIE